MLKVQIHVGGIRKLLYVFVSVWEIISLWIVFPYRGITIQSYNFNFYNDCHISLDPCGLIYDLMGTFQTISSLKHWYIRWKLKQCFQRKTMSPYRKLSRLLFIVSQLYRLKSINYINREYAQTQFWSNFEITKCFGFVCLFVFVALRPMSTAMAIAGRSVHLITLFPGQAWASG